MLRHVLSRHLFERGRHVANRAGGDVDVARLEHAARVAVVRIPLPQPFEGRLSDANGFGKPVRELGNVARP